MWEKRTETGDLRASSSYTASPGENRSESCCTAVLLHLFCFWESEKWSENKWMPERQGIIGKESKAYLSNSVNLCQSVRFGTTVCWEDGHWNFRNQPLLKRKVIFHAKLHFLVISHTTLFEVDASKFRSKMKLLLKCIFVYWKSSYFWKAEKGILGEGSI